MDYFHGSNMVFLYIDFDFLILIFFKFLTVHAFGMFVGTPDLQEGENPDGLFSPEQI